MSNFFKRATPLMSRPTTFQELDPTQCCVDDIFVENLEIALNPDTSVWELTLTLNDGSTVTGEFPAAFTDGSIAEDLAETLLAGNITGGSHILMSDDDQIQAVNGNSILDLRFGGDSNWLLAVDNGGGSFSSFVYGSSASGITLAQTLNSFGVKLEDDRIFIGRYDSGAPVSYLKAESGGVFVSAESTLATPTDSIASPIVIIDASTSDRNFIAGAPALSAVSINSGTEGVNNETRWTQNVENAVAVGGRGLTVKTNNAAYANKISLQQRGNAFDGLIEPIANTADRLWTFPDRSGIIHVDDVNVVHVYSPSDLPGTLVTDTTYVIHGTITVSSPILVANQNTAIIGLDKNNDKLVYTGNAIFLNIVDASFFMTNITLSATDPASLIIGGQNYLAGAYNEGRNHILSFVGVQFRNCYNVANFEGFDLIDFNNCNFFYVQAPTYGIRLLNVSKFELSSCELLRWFDETSLPTPSGYATCPMIDIQPNGAGVGNGAVNINSCMFHPQQTQDAIKIDASATIGFGTIAANNFISTGLTTGLLANFDYDIHNSFIIQANQGVANGNAKGTLLLSSNVIELSNSTAIGPPYGLVLNDANFVGGTGPTNPITFPVATRVITSSSNASFTYNNKVDGNFYVSLNATVGVNSNGTYTITIQFRQNGVPLPIVGKTTIRNSGGVFIGETLSLALQGAATQGDVFDIYVTCDTANNVLVSELVVNGFQY